MKNSKASIGNIEIILVIIGIKLGERFISLPNTSVENVGYASVISILLGGLLGLVISLIFVRLSLNFPDKTIIEFSQDILGKVGGKIVVLGFFIYFFVLCSMYIRRIGEFSKQEFLYHTPIEFIMIIFIFISAYCAVGGIPIITKVSDFLIGVGTITTILIIIITLPFVSYEELLPIFQIESLKNINIFNPGLTTYIGIEIILFLVPFMKKPKDIKKNTIIAMSLLTVIFTLDVLLSIGVLTEEVLKYRLFPVFDIGKTISFPAFFDIRFDIIYASLWIFLIYMVMVIYQYLSSITFAGLWGKKTHSVYVLLLAPLWYLVGLLPQTLAQTYIVLNILDQVWLYGIIGIIFIMYFVGVVRKKVKI